MATVTSINVNGLRDRRKMKGLLYVYRSDIMCIQETNWDEGRVEVMREEWEGDMFYNNGASNARGVAILIKKDKVDNIREVYRDQVGRILAIEFTYRKVDFRLINIYVPNVEVDKRSIIEEVRELIVGRCIVVGDFNIKCSRLDIGKGVELRGDKSRAMLLGMMADKGLVDVWRYENPEKREFTRRQMREGVLKQSRIDLVLVQAESIRYIDRFRHHGNSFSDHDGVRFTIKIGGEEMGGGVWILNAGYVSEEEYRQQIKALLDRENERRAGYAECDGIDNGVGERWERMKNGIKSISIRYSKRRKERMMREEKVLRERLGVELGKAEDEEGYSMEKYLEVKMELDRFEKEKCRGAILRSKAKYTLEGEKCTGFFLGLEKRKQSRAYINEINNKDGVATEDYVEILERVQEFYGELYKKGGVDEGSVDGVLDSVQSKVSEADRVWCDREISESEVVEAIGGLTSGKSPGSDGIGIEWYKEYKNEVAPILVEVFRGMERTGLVQGRMVEGVITILHKKGSRLDLGNYRPISLMNVDYKILTKLLANRVKRVIGEIVQPTQSYSVPGRDIADTIGTVRDVIEYMKRDGIGGVVVGIDWNKAFDRVEHEFLFRVLERFGFGEKLVGWVRRLYGGAQSCVKVNGVLTDRFVIERSVRQGCPLSALLYAIVVEPLATLIKTDEGVEGIVLPYGGRCVINHYADDTTITVRDGASVRRVLELVEKYGRASGAKINKDKSEIMYIGRVERVEVGLRVEESYMRVLGVNLGVDSEGARDATWTGVISNIGTVCNAWRVRKLKLKGKVVVVNSLLMSMCVYVMSVMEMPAWVMNELNKIVCNFIWEGKGVKVAQKTLVGRKGKGGLKLIDLEIKRKAMRIRTVQKYMMGRWQYGWKEMLKKYINDVGGMGENGWFMGFKPSMTLGIPEFYREVLEAWRCLLPKMEYDCDDIRSFVNLPLFLNEKIKCNNRTLYVPQFMEGGIRQVRDVINEVIPGFLRGNCIYDSVCEVEGMDCRVKVRRIYDRIKLSLPAEWVDLIQGGCVGREAGDLPELYVMEEGVKCLMKNMSVKKVYGWLIDEVFKEPAAERVWRRVFVGYEVGKIWSNINVKYNSIDCDNNDFLMRHNRIYTNVVLHGINEEVNALCDVCESGRESFIHYFLECGSLMEFFEFLKTLLKDNWAMELDVEDGWRTLFLFGVFGKRKGVNVGVLNYVLSHARHAVVLRRNYAHFEGRTVNIKHLFKAIMKRDTFNDKESGWGRHLF